MSSDSSAVFMLAFHRYSFILDGFDNLSICGRVSVFFCTVSLCSGKPAGIESEEGFCYNAYLFMRMPQVRICKRIFLCLCLLFGIVPAARHKFAGPVGFQEPVGRDRLDEEKQIVR